MPKRNSRVIKCVLLGVALSDCAAAVEDRKHARSEELASRTARRKLKLWQALNGAPENVKVCSTSL